MYSQSNAIACFNCAKGSFQPVQNSSSCQQCDLGLYQPRTGEPQCQMCPTGYATNSTESVKCSPCVEGRFASNQGASLCGKCPVGWSGPLPQQPECVVCLPGEAQKNSGFPACQDCQAGFFSASQGADRCVACSVGTYQEMAIETRCLDCPSGFTATEASRVCSPMPDSKDVLPPRLILAKVIFTEEKVLTGVQLSSPANSRLESTKDKWFMSCAHTYNGRHAETFPIKSRLVALLTHKLDLVAVIVLCCWNFQNHCTLHRIRFTLERHRT